MSDVVMKQWCIMFKNDRNNVHEKAWCGQRSIVNAELTKKISKMIRKNCCFIILDLSLKFSYFMTFLFCIVPRDLGYWVLCKMGAQTLVGRLEKAEYAKSFTLRPKRTCWNLSLSCNMSRNRRRNLVSQGFFIHDKARLYTNLTAALAWIRMRAA